MSSESDPPFLFELLQDENGITTLGPSGHAEYSDRAKKAQAEKRQKLYAKYPPVEKLYKTLIASERNPRPVRRLYGWAYPLRFIKAFAEQYECRVSLPDYLKKRHKKDSVIFGKLTEDEAADVDLMKHVDYFVHDAVEDRLQKAGGVRLLHGTPFYPEAFGIFYIYDNYNIDNQAEYIMEVLGLDPKEVVANIQKIISDCDPDIKALWHYDASSLKADLTTPL